MNNPTTMLSNEYDNQLEKTLSDFVSNKTIQKDFSKKSYQLFYPMIGWKYEQTPRILFVGRSLNGWDTTSFSTSDNNYSKILENSKQSSINDKEDPLGWVIDKKRKGWKPSRSRFWNVIHPLVKEINSNATDNDWYSYMAWSNIAKIAPARLKNGPIATPNGKERTAQKENAIELFKMEMKELAPDITVLITDWNLGEDFIKCLDWENYKSFNKVGYNNGGVVKAMAKRDNQKIILTVRPDNPSSGIKNPHFIDEVMRAINEY